MQKLYTKHYQTKILNTKKLKINNKIYIGFNINDLLNLKFYQKNPKIDFNFKGLSYINIKNIPESTLQSI
tara:strand:- start:520 stop:729 length:210 start_codon:yes stop_codon:yes gene_type:complete